MYEAVDHLAHLWESDELANLLRLRAGNQHAVTAGLDGRGELTAVECGYMQWERRKRKSPMFKWVSVGSIGIMAISSAEAL